MFAELQCGRSEEWVLKWYLCLECIWTVSGYWVCMSERMASVYEAYQSCNDIWTLNEYQNDCRGWSVSALYLNSERATEKHLCMKHLWAGDKFRMSDRMATVSGVYLDYIWSWDLYVISGTPFRIPSKGPIRITNNPKAAPLVITTPEPIPYSSKKAIPFSKQTKTNDQVPWRKCPKILGTIAIMV